MPLLKGKGKKPDSKSDMPEGKSKKEALAVAYSMKKKKMASGGTVSSGDPTMNYAKGGDVDPMMEVTCPHCSKSFSHGGEVANDSDPIADFMPNEFDDLALRDDLDSSYTGENSGDEKGAPEIVKRAMSRRKNK